MVRLAGNFVNDNGLASIEFGASVLGALLIMVLGHNQCGPSKLQSMSSPKMLSFRDICQSSSRTLKRRSHCSKTEGSLFVNATRVNILLTVESLRNSKPVLSDLIKENRLRVNPSASLPCGDHNPSVSWARARDSGGPFRPRAKGRRGTQRKRLANTDTFNKDVIINKDVMYI